MYKITFVPGTNLIRSTFSGLLTLPEVAAYDEELRAHFSEGRIGPSYAMIIDVGGCSIQLQEIVHAFTAHLAGIPQAAAVCVVTGSSMVRMQIRRVFSGTPIKIFDNGADAIAWVTRAALRRRR